MCHSSPQFRDPWHDRRNMAEHVLSSDDDDDDDNDQSGAYEVRGEEDVMSGFKSSRIERKRLFGEEKSADRCFSTSMRQA